MTTTLYREYEDILARYQTQFEISLDHLYYFVTTLDITASVDIIEQLLVIWDKIAECSILQQAHFFDIEKHMTQHKNIRQHLENLKSQIVTDKHLCKNTVVALVTVIDSYFNQFKPLLRKGE